MEERHLNGTMFNPMCEVFPKGDKITETKKLFRKKSFMFGLLGKDIGLTVQISQFLSNLTFSSWQLLLPTLQQGRSVKTDDFDDVIMIMMTMMTMMKML